ncbi:5-oxoprolinase subunit C family protein [Pedobacter hiemivivus]|uniref:Biotin-dependent carboxyltransferase family protein n=1 Tax=Pedobacter hiemivivus TaxID=2530454 RepID=A0A4R0NC51_9SPHI|nr:biotin-dependent carboxyltransferase family protein [Pedobacter hiemivivus]TCC97890.1 biotin-dependent carboxyltransferase family protein [Pedobacter hiemivivus]
MGIKVIKGGLLTTVQDLGRKGYRKDGIIVSGAMDTLALEIGNLLLGNDAAEAGLECTLLGPKLLFETDQLVAITGGNLSPMVDDKPVKMWRPVFIPGGSVLSFGSAVAGCRSYLTVSGGFDLPKVLGSYSTYLKAGFGGYKGRALKNEDELSFKKAYEPKGGVFNWSVGLQLYPEFNDNEIRVMKGPEYELFTGQSIAALFNEYYMITKEADRMGYRLEGAALLLTEPKEMLSSAVTFGTIQVTSNGAAILLMADHQTTGGYPRILQVITADLTKLAQMRSGQQIRFKLVTLAEARQAMLHTEMQLKQLKQTITLKQI